jgi:hypothetical protein
MAQVNAREQQERYAEAVGKEVADRQIELARRYNAAKKAKCSCRQRLAVPGPMHAETCPKYVRLA